MSENNRTGGVKPSLPQMPTLDVPNYDPGADASGSQVEAPPAPIPQAPKAPQKQRAVFGDLEVVALSPGFYDGKRRAKGDKFTLKPNGKPGSWMRCVDPQAQKEHEARLKEKHKVLQVRVEKLKELARARLAGF